MALGEVCVITCDGRIIQGTLAGHDQLQNLVLKEAHERVYQLPKENAHTDDTEENTLEMVPLGLYLIRGDNVAVVSDIRKGVWEEQEQSGFEGFESGEGVKPLFQATF